MQAYTRSTQSAIAVTTGIEVNVLRILEGNEPQHGGEDRGADAPEEASSEDTPRR